MFSRTRTQAVKIKRKISVKQKNKTNRTDNGIDNDNQQEAVLAQRDRATRHLGENLVNCTNKLYNKSTMELEGYS